MIIWQNKKSEIWNKIKKIIEPSFDEILVYWEIRLFRVTFEEGNYESSNGFEAALLASQAGERFPDNCFLD